MEWKQTIWLWIGVSALLLSAAVTAIGDELKVIPSVAVREDFNDNIFFDVNDPVDDFTTTVTAGIEVTDRTEIMDANLLAQISPFFYHDNDDLNDVDQNYRGQFAYRFLPRFGMNANAGFKVDNRPDREIYETGQLYDISRRFRYTGGIGADFAVSEIHSLNAAYAYEQDDWRGDSNNIDYNGHLINAGTSYNISRWLSASDLLVGVGYNFYDYDTADIKSGYGTVGLQRMLNEIFRFNINLGARYTETRFETAALALAPSGKPILMVEEQGESGWGGIGSLGLEYLGERTRCSLTFSHDLRPASGTLGPTNLTRAVFDINHRLHEKLSIGLATSYFMNEADAGEFYINDIDEDTFNINPRVRWQFLRHFTLEGAYIYSTLKDDVADATKDRHLVYLQVEFDYPVIE